jgi:hypothetical protein
MSRKAFSMLPTHSASERDMVAAGFEGLLGGSGDRKGFDASRDQGRVLLVTNQAQGSGHRPRALERIAIHVNPAVLSAPRTSARLSRLWCEWQSSCRYIRA